MSGASNARGWSKDPAPEPVLLITNWFGEFVWLVGGTDVPVGVKSLSVIIVSSPQGFGNSTSCRWSAILSLVRWDYRFLSLDRYL